jgi:putative ABC transport system substrate-binding protein
MTRREFVVRLAGAAAGWPLAAWAQPVDRVRKIGVLLPQPRARGWLEATFRETLAELGYKEGANLRIDVRSAEGRLSTLNVLAGELVRGSPDLILAANSPGTRAAIAATDRIPIVMVEVGDPVATGFVRNLARPERNVTGVTNMCGELAAKRLNLLKEIVPKARRVAIMLHPDDPITSPQVKDVERVAPSLGVAVRFFPVRTVAEAEQAFSPMLDWRADATMWLCGQQGAMADRTVVLAPAHHLPVMPYLSDEVRKGGLMSYSTGRSEMYRRAAQLVAKILNGAKPGDLPVEQPTNFELVINLKTAKALGIKIPSSVLQRADHVIQ